MFHGLSVQHVPFLMFILLNNDDESNYNLHSYHIHLLSIRIFMYIFGNHDQSILEHCELDDIWYFNQEISISMATIMRFGYCAQLVILQNSNCVLTIIFIILARIKYIQY